MEFLTNRVVSPQLVQSPQEGIVKHPWFAITLSRAKGLSFRKVVRNCLRCHLYAWLRRPQCQLTHRDSSILLTRQLTLPYASQGFAYAVRALSCDHVPFFHVKEGSELAHRGSNGTNMHQPIWELFERLATLKWNPDAQKDFWDCQLALTRPTLWKSHLFQVLWSSMLHTKCHARRGIAAHTLSKVYRASGPPSSQANQALQLVSHIKMVAFWHCTCRLRQALQNWLV